MNEEWRDIQGFEGLYQISNHGRVKSMSNRSNHKDEMIMKQSMVQGYCQITLTKDGIQKAFKVHRLVANAFLNNPLNLPEVNHINGIKTDNKVCNLEWITALGNARHAHATGLARAQKGSENPRSKKVIQMSMNGDEIAEFCGMREAERMTGISHFQISLCCRGKSKSAGGFKWKLKTICVGA